MYLLEFYYCQRNYIVADDYECEATPRVDRRQDARVPVGDRSVFAEDRSFLILIVKSATSIIQHVKHAFPALMRAKSHKQQ